MGTLVVVRHGQASLFAADYDELSAHGIVQAQRLGAHWGEHGSQVDLAFSGPAKRQRDTARHCGDAYTRAGRAWPETSLVRELDEHDGFGMMNVAVPQLRREAQVRGEPGVAEMIEHASDALDHKRRSAAFQQLFEVVMGRWLRGEIADANVETWPAFAARVNHGLDRLLAHDGPGVRLVAFTSVGPLAVMLQRALGLADHDAFRTAWRIRNASFTTFVFRGKQFTLDGFNALPHLSDPSSWTFR